MSATYVAWNGQSYPWPPPDGWYEAVDGRWWAPGSGPGAPLQSPDQEAQMPAATTPLPEDTWPEGAMPDEPLGEQSTVLTSQSPTGSMEFDQDDTDRHHAEHSDEVAPTIPATLPSAGAASSSTSTAAPSTPAEGVWQPPITEDEQRSKRPLLILGAIAGGLLVIILAIAAVRGGDDDPSTETGSTTSSAGQASSDQSTDGSGSNRAPADTATTSTATATTAPPDTSVTSETTAAETTSTAESTVTSLPDEAKIQQFRSALDGNGLSGELLSDQDVVDLGSSFCIVAVGADDFEEYVTFRQAAIAESGGELTEEELMVAVDAAVSAFCPDEAERLGLTG